LDFDLKLLPDGYSTVGLTLWPDKNGKLLITGFTEGYSAELCGLETGDIIIQVDEVSVEGMAACEAHGRSDRFVFFSSPRRGPP
jgi:C-terminal processing protease CtpA/Prc